MFMRLVHHRCCRSAFPLLMVGLLYLVPFPTLLAQEEPGDEHVVDTPVIVGGTPAEEGAHPWQAMLFDRWGNFFCGGTLIDSEWVLTAGHCTYGRTVEQVVLGAHRRMDSQEASRQTRVVDRIIRHHSYDDSSLNHDIALLHLSQPATLNQRVAPLSPVVAPGDDPLWDPGTEAVVTGWGALSEGGSYAAVLQEVTVPIVGESECRAVYPGGITDSMFCAGYPEGGKDACQGDSGGPLIVRDGHNGWRLAGIVSTGRGCARANSYGVYTKVAKYQTWITEKAGLSTPPTLVPTATGTLAPSPSPTIGTTPSPIPSPTPSPAVTHSPSPPALGIITNGDFETGNDGAWVERSKQHSVLIDTLVPVTPYSGSYAAMLGHANQETSRLFQRVKLPAADQLYLVFHHQIHSTEGKCGRDKARVYLSSRRALELSLCTEQTTTEWEEVIVDISRYANSWKKIQFFAKTSRHEESSWLIDDVYLTTTLEERRLHHVLQADDIEDREAEEDIELLYLPLILN